MPPITATVAAIAMTRFRMCPPDRRCRATAAKSGRRKRKRPGVRPPFPPFGHAGLGRHRLLQLLVDLVEEAFDGEPLLIGATEEREALGHEALLHRVDADLLQRVRELVERGVVVEL